VYYRSPDRQFLSVADELSVAAISDFLVNGTRPGYAEFSPERVDDLAIENSPMILVKFEVPRSAFGNEQFLLLTSLTQFNLPIFYFPFEHTNVFQELINPPADQETVVSVLKIVGDDAQKWVLTNPATPPTEFIAAVLNGTVPMFVKSEEVPVDNNGPVKKVVGSTYRQLVVESNIPFVLLLYTIENYVFDVNLEKLNTAAVQLGGRATFGYVNVKNNEIPLEVPEDLPAFVLVWKGNVQLYRRSLKLSIVEWIEAALPARE
jgi:hypothetical protein